MTAADELHRVLAEAELLAAHLEACTKQVAAMQARVTSLHGEIKSIHLDLTNALVEVNALRAVLERERNER